VAAWIGSFATDPGRWWQCGAILLQRIQVGGGNVERLKEVFLLELTEQECFDGANLITISCNGHLLAVYTVDGDGFNSRLEVGR